MVAFFLHSVFSGLAPQLRQLGDIAGDPAPSSDVRLVFSQSFQHRRQVA
jgi:hypothetical protein